MITLLLFAFILTTTVLVLLEYKEASKIVCSISLILFFIIGSGYLLRKPFRLLQAPYLSSEQQNWGKNNAIVVLGGGVAHLPQKNNVNPYITAYARIEKAVQLYRSCKASQNDCMIVLTGGDPIHFGEPEADVYQNELLKLGVRSSDIILEARSKSTYENALFTSPILKVHSFDKMFLVTSATHMKRALLIFSKFGINFTPEVADYIQPKASFIPTGANFALSDLIVHEYIGIMQFYIYNYFE